METIGADCATLFGAETNTVKIRTAVALATMVLGAAVGVRALAQEPSPTQPAPAQQAPAPQVPPRDPQADILLRLMQPMARPEPAGSMTRDDVHTLPPPKPDTLPKNIRFEAIVTDPRCLPGDNLFPEPGPAARYPGRRR
jgi:hypothetical protein